MAALHEFHNPFSTRYTRPGEIPYRFTETDSEASRVSIVVDDDSKRRQCWASILEQLQDHCWWGQIVGPHGTGKSTLLVELLAYFDLEGIITAHFELHDGQRRFPYSLDRLLENDPIPDVIVIDGYEQLGFWSRRRVTRWCCRHSVGLLITTHRRFDFPTLFETQASLELAESLVYQHLESLGASVEITHEEIRTRFEACHGNVRELFFSLYDLIERKRRLHRDAS
ncbi:MAG: ATP-binding protein [Planctomycetia bacterium]|jgi:hypothetical protein